MLLIQSVTYDKVASEYLIDYRDTISGKRVVYHANRLQENERLFALTCRYYYEDSRVVIYD